MDGRSGAENVMPEVRNVSSGDEPDVVRQDVDTSCMGACIVSLKVSIITPTWKRPKGLARSVGCVEAQTYKGPIEHLIIHDGREPLHHGKKGLSFQNERVREWCLDENHDDVGVTPLNAGRKEATGDLIMVLGDDNEIAPEHVAELAVLFEKEPNLGFAYSFGIIKDAPTGDVICPLNAQKPAYEQIDLGQLMIRREVDARFGPWIYTRYAYDWDRIEKMMEAHVPFMTNMKPTFCFYRGWKE